MLSLTESHSTLHALCVKPGIKFENQQDHEEVLLSLRAHPIILVPALFNSIIIAVLIFLLSFILPQFLNLTQAIYIVIFSYFITFIYLWFQIINWYFNIGIITNKQVVDVDFNAFFFRNVTRTELAHIEDVSVKVSGFIPGIFDFGSIYVQTAGTEINTEFINVPHPAKAAHIIQDILEEYGASR